jgi:hypothetical protein
LLEFQQERSEPNLLFGIVFGEEHDHADRPHALPLVARTTSGHAAAPALFAMNSRRLI